MSSSVAVQDSQRERIAGRYLVKELLGRGGMAVVYRVLDSVAQTEMALKQLHLGKDHPRYADAAVLFEREFHTLMQLSHPRIIEVYGYGVDESGPYYTMELLDGGDLDRHAPVPWRAACELMFDVCSSLALLHSRGLVHRDVSPRNIRYTHDGRAKLIDFGAMTAIGPCRSVVGTAPFVAPEVVHRSALDARTDLFSVGATLYSALTGHFAYPARKLSELAAVWAAQPRPPSSYVADIPPALDALVLSLISLDPASRARSAAEVMQRLAAIAGLERTESIDVSQAYLSAPVLVARERVLLRWRKRLMRALRGRGSAVLLTGPAGVGRSRMLDACALDAQILGATVLRAGAAGAKERPFALAQLLAEQLLEELPEVSTASAREVAGVAPLLFASEPSSGASQELELGGHARPRLRDLSSAGAETLAVQAALQAWLLRISDQVRLVIAVDDLHRADPASAGLVAGLAQAAPGRRMLVLATVEQDAAPVARVAHDLFMQHASALELAPLKRPETEALLHSLFGDVPQLGPLADSAHRLSGGRPRECMALAQHLVSDGAIAYEGGAWRLPEQLDAAALPRSMEEAFAQRIAALDPLARRLAQCHALARMDRLEREDYLELAGELEAKDADRAIAALVAAQVLWSDGLGYALTHSGWVSPLLSALAPEQVQERQRSLARLCARRGTHPLRVVHHLFEGGLEQQALDRIRDLLEQAQTIEALRASELSLEFMAGLFERALDCAERLGRGPREIYTLHRALLISSPSVDVRMYYRSAPVLLPRLRKDSGLDAWEALSDAGLSAQDRLMRALQSAMQAYEATPEHGRVFRPDEAIRLLVYHVGVSIAVAGRTLDEELTDSLPSLLEPFASLSPLVHALWQNALATQEALSFVHPERALTRWTAVHDALKEGSVDPAYVDVVRHAIAFALAAIEVRLGLSTARRWIDELDGDPLQAVGALQLRRVLRLQQGDWEGAERHRRKAELVAAQSNTRSLFTSLPVELAAQALASDLAGVKQTWEAIAVFAERHRGHVPYCAIAEGRYERIRGDMPAARAALERALSLCAPEAERGERNRWAWLTATAELMTVLVELREADRARELGLRALERCARLDIRLGAHDVVRALCLAEARCGEYTAANRRLKALIAEQRARGVSGLGLGASYEAGARIALWSGDEGAFEHFARLTAKEYRHGEGSALAVHYERLMSEARKAGLQTGTQLADFLTTSATTGMGKGSGQAAVVAKAMRSAENGRERAAAALRLLCEAKGAVAGHLYLNGAAGLALVASHGHASAPEGLLAAARTYLDSEIDRTETTTMMVNVKPDSEVVTFDWTDAAGAVYRPVVIISELDGEAVYAGVALVMLGARTPDQTGVPQLVAALGQHLIDAEDARPLRAAT